MDAFVQSKRTFYFLDLNGSICGLVTLSDLNSRQAKLFWFVPLCELEVKLARWIRDRLSEDEIRGRLISQARGNYEIDRDQGVEVHPVEYASFSNLLNVVRKLKLYGELGYDKKQFEALNSLVEMRNSVMHPVKSMVHDRESAAKLKERLDKLKEFLFRLRESRTH